MKIFWPYRSKAKGFSNEKLPEKYHEKTSSVSSAEITNQFLGEKTLKAIKKNSHYIPESRLSLKRGHWANRDFSEYREAV